MNACAQSRGCALGEETELVPGGCDMEVTYDNRLQYIEKVRSRPPLASDIVGPCRCRRSWSITSESATCKSPHSDRVRGRHWAGQRAALGGCERNQAGQQAGPMLGAIQQ